MKALTVWQPWATLIIEGFKPYEFRGWDYRTRARALVGKRIAIHAGARPMVAGEVRDILQRINEGTAALTPGAKPFLERLAGLTAAHLRGDLPRSAVLGFVTLGEPVRVTELFAGVIDSDRLDHGKWAWPLTEPEWLRPPVDWRGFQGFWNVPDGLEAGTLAKPRPARS